MSDSPGPSEITRRGFFQLLGAGLALSGCRGPHGQVYPYTRRPDGLTPGEPIQFATAMPLAGRAGGLLVESWDGRPTKVEGNPDHPVNQGAATSWQQAAIRQLYDEDRAREY